MSPSSERLRVLGEGIFRSWPQPLAAIRAGVDTRKTSPFTCRKSGTSPFLREWVTSFGRSGDVALFEIQNARDVVVLAVRHQREDDDH